MERGKCIQLRGDRQTTAGEVYVSVLVACLFACMLFFCFCLFVRKESIPINKHLKCMILLQTIRRGEN
jgi:hypothetical protein